MSDQKNQPVTIPRLLAKKEADEKIVALTAYDYPMARIVDEAGVDLILVGDSLGMVVLGYENTIPVTMDEMIHHTKAVSRGVKRALVVGDMPYFSFHLSEKETIFNASRFLKEASAKAVKIEGASPKRLKLIESMIEAEIPVMGHVGLTPQSINHLGRFRVSGKTLDVFHDLVGFMDGYLPKFVKRYAHLHETILGAVSSYSDDVRHKQFPEDAQSYHLKSGFDISSLLDKKREK
jgi:3-methyl-2-oxobutanoate hydroxymethyltransferase